MKKNTLMEILIVLVFVGSVFGTAIKPPEVEWSRTFGGVGSDHGYSVQQTKDGGYIISGMWDFHNLSNGDLLNIKGDVWLIKTDSRGEEEWNKTFGGASRDRSEGSSVQQTKDGGYIINGPTRAYGAGKEDVWLIKTDSRGKEEWNKTFGGAENEQSYSVQQTKDGGYIITGYTQSYGAGKGDVWLIKTDSRGKEEWNETFGGGKPDLGVCVQQTKDGGYIITGLTESYGAGGEDVWLIKVNPE